MAESTALKEQFGVELAQYFARLLSTIQPGFRSREFVARLEQELEPLELKGRMVAMAAALREFLPEDYPSALMALLQILEIELEGQSGTSIGGFPLLVMGQFVETYGLEYPTGSLAALHSITKHSSAEFAIRPYIVHHSEQTLKLLRRWARDPDPHVRRLVSEGTRPRLPWASRLKPFIADPTPVLELLEMLKDDPSEYVRRSVANNLNDIGKDHPDILVETAGRWNVDASPQRQWILKRALRSLVKQGDPAALAVLGFHGTAVGVRDLQLAPRTMRMNDVLSFSFTLESHDVTAQHLVVDYLMHFVKANGGRSPKVFKMTTCTIEGGGSVTLRRRHAIRPITTRRYYPGMQRLEIQVNGTVLAGAEFELEMEQG